jgi:hypothetical protein
MADRQSEILFLHLSPCDPLRERSHEVRVRGRAAQMQRYYLYNGLQVLRALRPLTPTLSRKGEGGRKVLRLK